MPGKFVALVLANLTNSKDQSIDQSAIYNSLNHEDSSKTECDKARGGKASSDTMPQLGEIYDLQASPDLSWVFVEKSHIHQASVGISAT